MSVPFRVADCVGWTNGELLQGPDDTLLSGVAIDSRRVSTGQLFVAIVGPNHDAHRFIPQALEQKAAALLRAGRRRSCHWATSPGRAPSRAASSRSAPTMRSGSGS